MSIFTTSLKNNYFVQQRYSVVRVNENGNFCMLKTLMAKQMSSEQELKVSNSTSSASGWFYNLRKFSKFTISKIGGVSECFVRILPIIIERSCPDEAVALWSPFHGWAKKENEGLER